MPLFSEMDRNLSRVVVFAVVLVCVLFLILRQDGNAATHNPSLRGTRGGPAKVSSYGLSPTNPKSRGLIFQVDNRPPGEGMTMYSAITNYAYAMRHGYDFKYYQMIPSAGATVSVLPGDPVNSAEKMSSVCSHPKYPRQSGWCRLLVMIELLKSAEYDWIHYMDSDAVFCNHELSISSFLSTVRTLPYGICSENQSNVSPDDALFLGTTSDPWMFWYITDGQLIIRQSPRALHLVEQWWWQDGAEYNFRTHPFEQGGLWRLEDCFMDHTTNMLSTVFFYEKDQYYCHFGSNVPLPIRMKGLAGEANKVKNQDDALQAIFSNHTFVKAADKLVAAATPTQNFPACHPKRFPHMGETRKPACPEPSWPADLPRKEYTSFEKHFLDTRNER